MSAFFCWCCRCNSCLSGVCTTVVDWFLGSAWFSLKRVGRNITWSIGRCGCRRCVANALFLVLNHLLKKSDHGERWVFCDFKLVGQSFKQGPFLFNSPVLNHLSEFLDAVLNQLIRVVRGLSDNFPKEVSHFLHEVSILAVLAQLT